MSSGREKYDGNLFGSGADFTSGRNSFNNESKIDRNASTKSSAREISRLNSEENFHTEEGNDKDRYLITYADLITLLLGLFIILYTISNIDAVKYKNVAQALGSIFGKESIKNVSMDVSSNVTESPKNKLIDQLSKLIENYNYTPSIQLEENERGITIHILDDILFPPGQAVLNENSKIVLNRLASVIKSIPNDIRIEGHTDNTPINTSRYPSNWHLSVDRALNTAYYLIQNEGVDPDKVSIVGYAEYRPIAPNDTPETRTKNRRVDLVILKWVNMKVNTTHFGEIEFTEDNIIVFEKGLLGFEHLTKFLFIKPEDNLFYWLTSIEDTDIAFPMFGIRVIDENYPQEENHEAFAIVVLNPDPLKITANLKAPVYINQNTKSGFQKIIDSDKYPVYYNLFTE